MSNTNRNQIQKISFLFMVLSALLSGCQKEDQYKDLILSNEIINESPFWGKDNFENQNVVISDSLISEAFLERGRERFEMGLYEMALDDVINSLNHDKNIGAYSLIISFPEDFVPLVIKKLETRALYNPNNPSWQYYLGKVYYHNKHDYLKAMEYFRNAYEIENKEIYKRLYLKCQELLYNSAVCYNEVLSEQI